jgi:hypothetical protein
MPFSGSNPMFLPRLLVHLTVAVAILALAASEVDAFPAIGGATPPKPGAGQQGKRPKGNKKGKQAGPFDTAIKDLKEADKELEAKKSAEASQMTRNAEQIVSQASKQANGQGGDKDKGKALDAVLKDIREAEKQIAARKPDDASTAIKSAITGLEGLTGAKKKK